VKDRLHFLWDRRTHGLRLQGSRSRNSKEKDENDPFHLKGPTGGEERATKPGPQRKTI